MTKIERVPRIPIKRFEQKRKFAGRTFMFVERNLLKPDADRIKAALSYRGNLVRILHTKLGFEVWACPKGRKAKKS